MATLTITNIPEDLFECIRSAATRNGLSIEEELRILIVTHFRGREEEPTRDQQTKEEALRRIRERWEQLPETTPADFFQDVTRWRDENRND